MNPALFRNSRLSLARKDEGMRPTCPCHISLFPLGQSPPSHPITQEEKIHSVSSTDQGPRGPLGLRA